MMYDNLTSPDPVKIFGLFHITGGLTRSEVHRYWHGPHAEMGLQLKADTIIRKYSQNHTLLDYVAPDPRYRYDGASIAYFDRSEEHTSELQSLMRISYAVFCLKKKMIHMTHTSPIPITDTHT